MRASKGRQAWEDENFDDYEDYDEEDEEYDEDEDYALAQKQKEAKKAAAAKQAAPSKKAAPAKPKETVAPKKVAPPAPAEPLTSDQKRKIEEQNRKANRELADDLFGTGPVVHSRPNIALPEGKTFDNFEPTSEADWDTFAQYVGGHLAVHGSKFEFPNFLKEVLKLASEHLVEKDFDELEITVHSLREASVKAKEAARAQPSPAQQQPVRTRADDYGDFM